MHPDRPHYCVISHTHWDREWYQPFEVFRVQLVDLIDRLLDVLDTTPEYVFHLDAQTIVLEDYLAIRPHRRRHLAAFIAARRLLVGPWYVQNDFFLTSGESTIRNLLIGTALAAEFGYCSKIGYAPDQFGLTSQLPQTLRGFGIDHCILGRGYGHGPHGRQFPEEQDDRPAEFVWISPDGTDVLGISLPNWYNNAQRFSADRDRALRFVRQVIESSEKWAATPYHLLMNGVDHLEPQEDLLPILRDLESSLGGARIYQTTFEDYVAKVQAYLRDRPLPEHHGELRSGPDQHILQGTLSSRTYLKRQNVLGQALLENHLEPLWAIVGMSGSPEAYPTDFMTYLWKQLLKNQPHDNICGCSRDAVHDHMEDRTRRLFQCGHTLLRRGLQHLCDRLNRNGADPAGYRILAVNTLATARHEVLTATVRFPREKNVAGLRITNADGTDIPFEMIGETNKAVSVFSPINLPGQLDVREVTVRFEADLPPLGYATFGVLPTPAEDVQPVPVRPAQAQPDRIENEYLQLVVDAETGRIDLWDKTRDVWIRDALALEDEADLGNSYWFSPEKDAKPLIVSQRAAEITCVEHTDLVQSLRVTYHFDLPVAYDFPAAQRHDSTCANRATLTFTLHKGLSRLDVDVELENHAKDHRVRLLVRSEIAAAATFSSSPFDLVRRDYGDRKVLSRWEPVQPNSGLVLVSDGQRSLAVFNEGLFAYEYQRDERGTIALTLVRATGTIGGHGDAIAPSEEWIVPGNQCLRTLNFRVGLMPGGAEIANPEARFREFLVPPLVHFDAVDPTVFSGGRPCVQDTQIAEIFHRPLPASECMLPLRRSVISLDGDAVLSALKRAEDGSGWVVRIFNPGTAEVAATLSFDVAVTKAQRLRLDETPLEEVPVKAGAIKLALAPKRIETLHVTVSRSTNE